MFRAKNTLREVGNLMVIDVLVCISFQEVNIILEFRKIKLFRILIDTMRMYTHIQFHI